jgi:curved DNA-binding protein CbpA
LSVLISEADIIKACRTLFGPEVTLSQDFLCYLQPSGAKSAYRQKVKETHPDSFAGMDSRLLREKTGLFQELVAAYETVSDFFKQRESGLWVVRDRVPAGRPAAGRSAGETRRRDCDRGFRDEREDQPRPGRFVPARPLEIGLFLYYQGIITYRQLIDALIWQRKQRPNLGDIAQRWGWLSEQDVKDILRHRGLFGRFGEKAVNLEFLTRRQLNTLLFFQRSKQQKLGRFFVDHSILSAEQMERLATEQKTHNARVVFDCMGRSGPGDPF